MKEEESRHFLWKAQSEAYLDFSISKIYIVKVKEFLI